MVQMIDKTVYLEYLNCPKNAWLKLHKPELKKLFGLTEFEKHLTEQGMIVENFAQRRFPHGTFIKHGSATDDWVTQQHIKRQSNVLFQTTFSVDVFLARTDVLEYNSQANEWYLYEIKSASSTNENARKIDHIEDASFQAILLKEKGIKLAKIFILHLNSEYVMHDKIDINLLFKEDDITDQVNAREKDTRLRMQKAKEDLFQDNENTVKCNCVYRGRSSHCSTFTYSHPYVPNYSVHDIARIGGSKAKLAMLINSSIFEINDIPAGFELTEKQNNQVCAYKQQVPMIDHTAIKRELDGLTYPLYFFDYETYAPAIPLYKGFRPYQHMPVQFSLHVVKSRHSEPEHLEYLHTSNSDPSISIIQKLKEYIGSEGTIIVWYKSFEKSKNSELAERHTEHKEFLEGINTRLFDLMDIFEKQMYVHAGFKGSASIKKILPVVVPTLSYDELAIHDGAAASQKWFEMIGKVSPVDQCSIADDLRDYCRLDTYAMYAIWKHLLGVCDTSYANPTHKVFEHLNVD